MRTHGRMALALLLAAPLATPALTLTQSTDLSFVGSGTSGACTNGGGNADNSYYRVFDLAALGLEGDVRVSSVRAAVEVAYGDTHTLVVKLYRLTGDLAVANLTQLGPDASVPVPAEELTFHDVAIEPPQVIAATEKLVVELFTPANASLFWIGSNSAGQSAPTYVRAATCGINEPVSMADVGFPGMHLLLALEVDDTLCGDGLTEGAELCDDGNLDDGDGCDSNCTATACGNGVVTAGEVCDDGNLEDDDGCSSTCTVPSCGDGVLDPGEECDDGNLLNWDECTSICAVASYTSAAGGSSGCSSGGGAGGLSLALLGLLVAAHRRRAVARARR